MATQYYAVSLNDIEKLKKASSGGMAYAVCEKNIRMGGIVYGVKYADDFLSAHYARIDNLKDLDLLSGSKYIITEKKLDNKKSVFQSIYDDISNNKLVIFIGIPCDVDSLYKYLKAKECRNLDNLSTIDFICQGPLNAAIQKDYIKFLEYKYDSEIVDFSVRYKNPFWEPVYLKASFKNGKEHIKPLYETDFGRAFMILGQERCYQCMHKGDNHSSDITIGDFWGIAAGDKGYNKYGTSVAIVHTEKGHNIINSLETITASPYTSEKAIGKNTMYYESRKRHKEFYRFKENYTKKGLHKTVFITRSFPSKIKYLLYLCLGKKPY